MNRAQMLARLDELARRNSHETLSVWSVPRDAGSREDPLTEYTTGNPGYFTCDNLGPRRDSVTDDEVRRFLTAVERTLPEADRSATNPTTHMKPLSQYKTYAQVAEDFPDVLDKTVRCGADCPPDFAPFIAWVALCVQNHNRRCDDDIHIEARLRAQGHTGYIGGGEFRSTVKWTMQVNQVKTKFDHICFYVEGSREVLDLARRAEHLYTLGFRIDKNFEPKDE